MKQVVYLAALLGMIFVFWNHTVLYPLKLLVVFFHESSHALATVLTGGTVQSMVIVPQQGGYVISVGGNRFLTLSAGYLGSLLWGMVIYLLAATTDRDKTTMMVLGGCVAGIALVYIRNLFGLAFCCMTGLGMIGVARLLNREVNDFLLRVIGLTSMMYVPLDIYSDTILRAALRSDARMLAEEFGGATMAWGGLWMVVSIIAVLYSLRWSLRTEPSEPSKFRSEVE